MLGNKLLNIQFAKYHIWNNKKETFNQSVRKNTVTQYHQCSREKKKRCFISANFDNFATFVDRAVFTFIKDWSDGFPNMVLSTEYSEAVNARYTFQPL